MATKLAEYMSELDEIIKSAGQRQKTQKRAGDNDPPTSHPVDDADDGTRPAATGAEAASVDSEVKDTVGPTSVTATEPRSQDEPPNKPEGELTVTGPDEGAPSVKARPDDPGTSHPANADTVGEKYSSYGDPKTWTVEKAAQIGNEVLADIATAAMSSKNKTAAVTATPAAASATNTISKAAGHAVGTAVADALQVDKSAADLSDAARSSLIEIVKMAHDSADRVADYLDGMISELNKTAEGDPPPPVDPAAGGPAGAEAPPAAAGEAAAGGDDNSPNDELAEITALIEEISQETGLPPEQVIQVIQEMEATGGAVGGEAAGPAAAGPAAPPMPPEAPPSADNSGGGMIAAASRGVKKQNHVKVASVLRRFAAEAVAAAATKK